MISNFSNILIVRINQQKKLKIKIVLYNLYNDKFKKFKGNMMIFMEGIILDKKLLQN